MKEVPNCLNCVHLRILSSLGSENLLCGLDENLASALKRCEKGKCPFFFSYAMAVMHSDFIPTVEMLENEIKCLSKPATYVERGFDLLIDPYDEDL